MRNPGLLHGPVRVECQDVKKAHRKPCQVCGRVPANRRLAVTVGSGRSAFSYILCIPHGQDFAVRRQTEYENLIERLGQGGLTVRLTPDNGDPSWGGYAKERKAEAAEKRKAEKGLGHG